MQGRETNPLGDMNSAAPSRAIEVDLVRLSGARAVRIGDAGNSFVAAHSHDWPILSIYVLGEHEKIHDCGSDVVSGPAATLHLAGAVHANAIARYGFEQVDIEFDPSWLPFRLPTAAPIRCWRGGRPGAGAVQLLRTWLAPSPTEADLRRSTGAFLASALQAEQRSRPLWVDKVATRLRGCAATGAEELAAIAGLSPAWLPQAYRAHYGEGIAETRRRGRVERALIEMRNPRLRLCDIAAAAGFFDQSHMTRDFHRTLGRTPAKVRAEYRLNGSEPGAAGFRSAA